MTAQRVCIAFLVFVAFALYGQNLDDYFLGDDFDLITSFYGKPASYLFQLLYSNESGTVWSSMGLGGTDTEHGYIRPLKIWLLKLDLTLWGPNPLAFHVTATAFFALNVILVFKIFEALRPGRLAFALLAAWTVAIHPVFSEIVPMITFREETVASALVLLSFFSFLRHRTANRSPLLFWLFYVLALLTKESAISAFGLAIGYDVIQAFIARESRREWLQRAKLYWPLVPILILYFALRWSAFESPLGNPETHFFSPRIFFLFHTTFFEFLFHETTFELWWVPLVGPLGVLLLGVGLALILRNRSKLGKTYLGLLVFLGPVWYACTTSVLYGVYFAARHNILPVVGIILFVVMVFEGVCRGIRPRWEKPAVAVAMIVTAFLFVPSDLRLSREFHYAAKVVEATRALIEAETLGVPDGGAVLLNNVPQLINRPFYFGWGLQSALKKPFTQSDLANRALVINRRNIEINNYRFETPEKYNKIIVLKLPRVQGRSYDFLY